MRFNTTKNIYTVQEVVDYFDTGRIQTTEESKSVLNAIFDASIKGRAENYALDALFVTNDGTVYNADFNINKAINMFKELQLPTNIHRRYQMTCVAL